MPEQFVIPQAVDAESKIMGPVTARQFVILVVTALIGAIIYLIADFTLFIILVTPVAGVGLTLAFVRINGQAFHFFMLNIAMSWRKPSTRVWLKINSDEYLKQLLHREIPPPIVHAAKKDFTSVSRLNELSLIVNTGGSYRPEDDSVL